MLRYLKLIKLTQKEIFLLFKRMAYSIKRSIEIQAGSGNNTILTYYTFFHCFPQTNLNALSSSTLPANFGRNISVNLERVCNIEQFISFRIVFFVVIDEHKIKELSKTRTLQK